MDNSTLCTSGITIHVLNLSRIKEYHEKLCKEMNMTKKKCLNEKIKIIYNSEQLMIGFKCKTY